MLPLPPPQIDFLVIPRLVLAGPSREWPAIRQRELLGRRLVAYRTSVGKVVLMDAACSHLGTEPWQRLRHERSPAVSLPSLAIRPRTAIFRIPSQKSRYRRGNCRIRWIDGISLILSQWPRAAVSVTVLKDDPGRLQSSVAVRHASRVSVVSDQGRMRLTCSTFGPRMIAGSRRRRRSIAPAEPFAQRTTGTFIVSGESWQDRITRLFARVPRHDVDHRLVRQFDVRDRHVSPHDELWHGDHGTEPTPGVYVRVIVFVPRSTSVLGRVLEEILRCGAGFAAR